LTVAGVLIFAPPLIASVSPFIARPGRRLLLATWVASLWPLFILWSLHAAWAIAYGFLGHSPGPADNGNVINVLDKSMAIVICLALFSTIFCLFLQLFFVSGDSIEVSVSQVARAIPILLMPFVWHSVVMILRWDPLGAFEWLMD
jgi:hypothetical protein